VTRFQFGDFELDAAAGRLTHAGTPVTVPARHLDVLAALLSRAGQVISKDALVEAAWRDVAVTDNSLEQAISSLRRALARPAGGALIETVPRQGYRFAGDVRRVTARATDDTLDALLAPYRAFVEGRAALETLAADRVAGAARAFETALAASPDSSSAHVGLATACAMRFEMTRADPSPAVDALAAAARHAREACRLDPGYGEGWATLGFVLDRTGASVDAVAALSRAVSLEADNWRHHLRLAAVSWGEARLRAARRTLTLLPGCPLAHWLAATVHVARHSLDEAERELVAGCAAVAAPGAETRFSGVALEWLLGLIWLSRGDAAAARQHFARELAAEAAGHLYARECCANVWYAIGAMRWRDGDRAGAGAAFEEARQRVESHALASAMLHCVAQRLGKDDAPLRTHGSAVDAALAHAVALTCAGKRSEAAAVVDAALAAAPPGGGGWILPVEPVLQAGGSDWEPVLARLRSRAA
jgi:DNA-binding winged helix-turn-helix (wHTH) protein